MVAVRDPGQSLGWCVTQLATTPDVLSSNSARRKSASAPSGDGRESWGIGAPRVAAAAATESIAAAADSAHGDARIPPIRLPPSPDDVPSSPSRARGTEAGLPSRSSRPMFACDAAHAPYARANQLAFAIKTSHPIGRADSAHPSPPSPLPSRRECGVELLASLESKNSSRVSAEERSGDRTDPTARSRWIQSPAVPRASSATALARDACSVRSEPSAASLDASDAASALHARRGSIAAFVVSASVVVVVAAAIALRDAETSRSLVAHLSVAAWSLASLLAASATPSHASDAASSAASSSARAQRSAAVATRRSASDARCDAASRFPGRSGLRVLGAGHSPSPAPVAARAASWWR